MPWLLLLFVVLPALELALLIEVGSRIGTAATLALIAGTGVAGAALARRQGMGVLRELRGDVQTGRLPGAALVDGVIILVAGALLVTPGMLTDAFGFLCLVPAFRARVRAGLRARFERAVEAQRIHVVYRDLRGEGEGPPAGSGPIIDLDPEPPGDER